MKNLLKEVKGNIYGMGIYCFKDEEGIVRYVGSGMLNDRLQSHLYNLKRGLYEGTNKDILQRKYNLGLLIFEVLHYSENNSEYLHMTDKEKQSVQKALEVMEQMYVNLFRDSICNKMKHIKKTSSSPTEKTTIKRSLANQGSNNPHAKYDETMIANILWLKNNGYNSKQIEKIYEDKGIKSNYICCLGITKWIHLEAIKPDWIA